MGLWIHQSCSTTNWSKCHHSRLTFGCVHSTCMIKHVLKNGQIQICTANIPDKISSCYRKLYFMNEEISESKIYYWKWDTPCERLPKVSIVRVNNNLAEVHQNSKWPFMLVLRRPMNWELSIQRSNDADLEIAISDFFIVEIFPINLLKHHGSDKW